MASITVEGMRGTVGEKRPSEESLNFAGKRPKAAPPTLAEKAAALIRNVPEHRTTEAPPASACEMLATGATVVFALPHEERHPMQTRIADLCLHFLREEERSAREEASTAENEAEEADMLLAMQEGSLEAREKFLTQSQQTLADAKSRIPTEEAAGKDAAAEIDLERELYMEAQQARTALEDEFTSLCTVVEETLEPILGGADHGELQVVEGRLSTVIARMNGFGAAPALIEAARGALLLAPAMRSAFDVLTAEAVRAEFVQRASELERSLAAARRAEEDAEVGMMGADAVHFMAGRRIAHAESMVEPAEAALLKATAQRDAAKLQVKKQKEATSAALAMQTMAECRAVEIREVLSAVAQKKLAPASQPDFFPARLASPMRPRCGALLASPARPQ